MAQDEKTASAFANSWNNLPSGSIYTHSQFEDWLAPLKREDIEGRTVLEMGCGNGSLMFHMASWAPSEIEGIDLGDSVVSARKNMQAHPSRNWTISQADLVTYSASPRDVVYSIGVLHHLKDPRAGFDSVVANTRPGGRFHCWVYAREGNAIVRWLVDPIRRIVSGLPWWFTKYLVATPLAVPFFLYAKGLGAVGFPGWLARLPLFEYCRWISEREFSFFRHVAFDQLVTPQTAYIERSTIEQWLNGNPRVESQGTYIILRNGNSWKFGGTVK